LSVILDKNLFRSDLLELWGEEVKKKPVFSEIPTIVNFSGPLYCICMWRRRRNVDELV